MIVRCLSASCRLLATGLVFATLASAPTTRAQAPASEYVSFWNGHLRVFATAPGTEVTLLDVSTGLPLDPASWTGNFATNPFVLANVGDSFEGNSRGVTQRVHMLSRAADGSPTPKPIVAWTGNLSSTLIHPLVDPVDENAWASYIPDVIQGVPGSVGGELGQQFIGFSSRDLIVIAEKTGTPVQIQVEDLATNADADTDDTFALDSTSPYLVHEDADIEVYRYASFEDDTIHVTSNVPTTVLAGILSPLFTDWCSTPVSYAAADSGRELGTLFYAFVPRSLAIMPIEDLTRVTITDLSDGDDTYSTLLTNGDRLGTRYDLYIADRQGQTPLEFAFPRATGPQVALRSPNNGFDDDFVKITADRPVLVHIGPITSNTNEFSDVAYSVATGPTSQILYTYAQNGGANDFQLFSFHEANSIRITSLTYTFNWGTGFSDFSIPDPTPFNGGNLLTYDWFWSNGTWGGELLRIESDWPVQVMSGDYDSPNFGAFIPFVEIVSTRPPVADAGPDLAACPGMLLTLDGSASADTDTIDGGRVVSFSWDLDVAVDSDANSIPDDDVDAGGPVVMASFPLGTTVVKLTYTDDDGESADALVTIVAEDDEAPVIDCPPLIQIVAEDLTGADVAPMATVSDNCEPLPPIVNDRTPGGADASDRYPCGSTYVTFTADDAAGNMGSCITEVRVDSWIALTDVGPTLRVTRRPDGSPELDWSLSGPPGADVRFQVLLSDTAAGDFLRASGGGPLAEQVWLDGAAGTDSRFYDVRTVTCDGALSAD